MKKFLVAAMLILASCGDDDGGSGGGGPDTSCSKEERTGAYDYVATATTGDCHFSGPGEVHLTNGVEGVGPGCTLVHETWSEDECTLDRALDCDVVSPPHCPDCTMQWTGSTTQNYSGSEFEGDMVLTVVDNINNTILCSETIHFVYTQQ